MPNSPITRFTVDNQNVEINSPVNGVSMVLARTTKGPFNDPSTLITTYSQFQRVFGSEIVPDGTPSNIEKALLGGSKLRIIRVQGSGAFRGELSATTAGSRPTALTEESDIEDLTAILTFTLGTGATATSVNVCCYTKTYDMDVDGMAYYYAKFLVKGNTLYHQIYGEGKNNVMEEMPIITFKNTTGSGSSATETVVDYTQLYNWFHNSAYLQPVVQVPSTGAISGVTNEETLLNWLKDNVDGTTTSIAINVRGAATVWSGTPATSVAAPGYSGATPTKTNWIASLDYVRDYVDMYNVICSHLDQHLSTNSDVLEVHQAAKVIADELDEWNYFIEVPKYTTHYTSGTTARTKTEIISWITTCMGTVGNSRNVAYFAGGIKYYKDGLLTSSDVLGTILGLADYSGATYGPWKSFAGMNRGLITDGKGPVCPNYGSPSRYSDLDALAQSYANMIVIKDTSTSGKQTMLWHCFTSQVKQDSFKFIAINNLVHYLKKQLRPIMDRYIEEANYIPTWKNIWYEVKPILDNLVSENAMSEYTWYGDQDATDYDDMVMNTEAEVRQGHYKAKLVFKEIVPLQDITIGFVLDKTTKATTSTVE